MRGVRTLILFYVEFDNGDSNCYQGSRVPTIDEAKVLCKKHMDDNAEWKSIAFVGEVDRKQAEGLWNLSRLNDNDWPTFQPEIMEKVTVGERPFAYVCSPSTGADSSVRNIAGESADPAYVLYAAS